MSKLQKDMVEHYLSNGYELYSPEFKTETKSIWMHNLNKTKERQFITVFSYGGTKEGLYDEHV